jgi:hypothetical protein
MRKDVSKNKPKGKEFGELKNLKKSKRMQEEKRLKSATENRRQNSEARKIKKEERVVEEKVLNVKIVGFRKGMLLVDIEGEIEKRAFIFSRKKVRKDNFKRKIGDFEIKLYGNNVKIENIKGYEDIKDQLIWEFEELF